MCNSHSLDRQPPTSVVILPKNSTYSNWTTDLQPQTLSSKGLPHLSECQLFAQGISDDTVICNSFPLTALIQPSSKAREHPEPHPFLQPPCPCLPLSPASTPTLQSILNSGQRASLILKLIMAHLGSNPSAGCSSHSDPKSLQLLQGCASYSPPNLPAGPAQAAAASPGT